MFYSAGRNAVWNESRDRPHKGRKERVPPIHFIEWERSEWLRGYDEACEEAAIYEAGFNGTTNPYKPNSDEYVTWHRGNQDALCKLYRKRITPIVENATLDHVLVTHYHPYEDHETGDRFPPHTTYKKIGKKSLIRGVVEFLLNNHPNLPKTLGEVLSCYRDNESGDESDCVCNILTTAEAKKERFEKRFREMEKAANQFAAGCKYKLGTIGFLRELERAIGRAEDQKERWNNSEVRHEEWAACRYAGVSSDVYFDDLNFENGRYSDRIATLEEVWKFIEQKFPLLMMRYQEIKRRRRAKKEKS
jgi:hypothetical protein